MARTMLELFKVPVMYVAIQAGLSFYVSGQTTDILTDPVDGVSCDVPIYEGYALSHAIVCPEFAGQDLTDDLTKILIERDDFFTMIVERETVRDVRDRLCYIAPGLRHGDEGVHWELRQGEDPCVAGWKQHRCEQRVLPLPRAALPAAPDWG